MPPKFVHLHAHTEYSLLDGMSRMPKLLAHIKENNMDSVAVTDHGVMYGIVDFYKEAKKAEVKPILGMEGYITSGSLEDKSEKGKNYHLLLLAKNNVGYQNLMKLTSIAHVNGFYYRPRFDRGVLKKYSEGLIVTSACPLGELGQALIQDNNEEAKKVVQWYLDVFGENYYLELQRHDFDKWAEKSTIPEIKSQLLELHESTIKVNEGALKLSREMGIPIVATNDAHYIKKEDAPAQDALVCISTGKTISDIKRMRYIDTPDFYIKSPEEMAAAFSDLPDALSNTVKIAESCEVEITLGKWFFPQYDLPKGKTADEALRDLAHEQLKIKVPNYGNTEIERLDYELDIICTKGYAPYFLIVQDLAKWSRSQGIITNTRGSAAGSFTSFVLGITTVDPIKYYLPFERFLNPFRPSPPDIDFDVADDKRDQIIGYIADTYGHEKTAQICTFGRMLSRAAVRDVARVLGYPYAIGDKIAKIIPPPKQGFPITIPKAMEEVPELKELYKNDQDTKKIIDLAMSIEGNARHMSVHAAGVVVAPSDITEFSPIQKEPSGEKIITQYEMHACEDVGLIKFDILGIRNLSILGAAIEIVKETTGKEVDISTIPLDDKKTFEMLSRGDTMGTFQLGGSGMTRYLKELKPNRVEDLMAMVALFRPGPMSQIPEYIKRKNDPKLVKYLDPRMEKFLGSSYGLIVYQDDLLFCALDLAGYTWEEADKFRKAVGKKIPAEMAAQKEKFTNGIIANGQTSDFAEMLWKLFEPFQSYGFNKAHAASYGIVAYQTSYMKANFPVEYMCALLTAEANDTEKIAAAISECRRIKIKVLPPDINESSIGFKIVTDSESLNNQAIRFGLNAVKNVGKAAIEAIIEARTEQPFSNLIDFLTRVDARRVNKKVLESLIKVGALSDFGKRSSLISNIDAIRSKIVKKDSKGGSQDGLFSNEEITSIDYRKDALIELPDGDEFSDEEIENLERQLLGFSLSAKPVSELLKDIEHLATHKIQDVMGQENVFNNVKVAAVISEIRTVVTKKSGQEMAFVKVRDDTGTIGLVVFPKTYQSIRDFLTDNKPLLISGKIDQREEEPSIIVDQITTNADSMPSDKEKFFIKIPQEAGEIELKKLKDVFLKFPGNHRVVLIFNGNKNVELPIGVAWSKELAHLISQIFSISQNLD